MFSCVCRYHEYQRMWIACSGQRPSSMVAARAAVGKNFGVKGKGHKIQGIDPYAVVVKKDGIHSAIAHINSENVQCCL